jgi:hypothetical protein
MAEQFANIGSAVLNMGGTLSSGATSITVASEIQIPSTGTFRALIQNELIKVTAVSSHTWTVVRGDGGTTAATHLDGTTIYVVVTKEALDALVSVQLNGTETSNRRILNFDNSFTVADNSGNGRVDISSSPYAEVIVPPVLGSFTLDGHSVPGTPTATTQGRSIYIYHPGTTADSNVEFYITVPATPYSVIAKIIPFGLLWGFTSIGLYFGDGTKLSRIVYQLNSNAIIVDRFSTWNTFNTNSPFVQASSLLSLIRWLKIRDTGTTKSFHISPDGINFMQVYSESSSTYLTTTRVGVCVNGLTTGANNGKVAGAILESWQVTP